MIIDIVKVFLPSIVAFALGIAITPLLTSYLYKNRMWKKRAGKVDLSGNKAEVFNSLHKDREVNTPRMGGVVIWLSAAATIVFFWALSQIFPTPLFQKIDFLSRDQTWIPFTTLILGGLVGLIDDWFEIRESAGEGRLSQGLSLKKRLAIVALVGLLCGAWFYYKLDVTAIGLPQVLGNLEIGFFLIPLFALVTVVLYSGGVIDGIDGLAGGVFAIIFGAYAGIAFYLNQINLAAFCAMVAGSILAFLWFNIPPARFYMSETGTMGLTVTLSVVAFMTDSLGGGYGLIVLPVIAFPLLATTLSNIIQVASKKMRGGKKIFLIAPIHHHFEALGWPPYKVTMRFWIIGIVFSILGVILALIG